MDYIKLLRVKHYVKNLIIFLPLIFAGELFNKDKLLTGLLGFLAFSAVSSAVYIFNDIKDIEKDRRHTTKRNRPIASGRVPVTAAWAVMAVCVLCAAGLSVALGQLKGALILLLYLALNIAYSMGLKKKPIIDIVILASGFVIRLFYGGAITGIEISQWLFLVVGSGSLFLALGKRRNEINQQSDTRDVLKYYNTAFLDKNMYVCVTLANVFYSLWALEFPGTSMSWSIPLFILMLMCYSLEVERESDGDPVEVIMHSKPLICFIAFYAAYVFAVLYLHR